MSVRNGQKSENDPNTETGNNDCKKLYLPWETFRHIPKHNYHSLVAIRMVITSKAKQNCTQPDIPYVTETTRRSDLSVYVSMHAYAGMQVATLQVYTYIHRQIHTYTYVHTMFACMSEKKILFC